MLSGVRHSESILFRCLFCRGRKLRLVSQVRSSFERDSRQYSSFLLPFDVILTLTFPPGAPSPLHSLFFSFNYNPKLLFTNPPSSRYLPNERNERNHEGLLRFFRIICLVSKIRVKRKNKKKKKKTAAE